MLGEIHNCPKCHNPTTDDWIVEVNGQMADGACQECWEEYSDNEWWKQLGVEG